VHALSRLRSTDAAHIARPSRHTKCACAAFPPTVVDVPGTTVRPSGPTYENARTRLAAVSRGKAGPAPCSHCRMLGPIDSRTVAPLARSSVPQTALAPVSVAAPAAFAALPQPTLAKLDADFARFLRLDVGDADAAPKRSTSRSRPGVAWCGDAAVDPARRLWMTSSATVRTWSLSSSCPARIANKLTFFTPLLKPRVRGFVFRSSWISYGAGLRRHLGSPYVWFGACGSRSGNDPRGSGADSCRRRVACW
jgi:hypothetical protein